MLFLGTSKQSPVIKTPAVLQWLIKELLRLNGKAMRTMGKRSMVVLGGEIRTLTSVYLIVFNYYYILIGCVARYGCM